MKKEQKILYGAKEDKTIKNGERVYDPVAGLLIIDALRNAVADAKKHNEHVHAIINDVHMHIMPNTSVERAKAAFDRVSQARLAAALRACEKLKKQGK